MRKSFQTIILERFMGTKELEELEKEYNKYIYSAIKSWEPTKEDYEFANHNPARTIDEFHKFWELKTRSGTIHRLAKMLLIQKKDETK